jgi:hypothetical protein
MRRQFDCLAIHHGRRPVHGLVSEFLSPDAYNDVEHPNRVVPEQRKLTFGQGESNLPAHSLTIVKVPVD